MDYSLECTNQGRKKEIASSYSDDETQASVEETLGSFGESVPSIDSIASLLNKCTNQRLLLPSLWLHAHMHNMGLENHISLGNLLVSLLVEVGRIQEAQQLFDKLFYRNECSWNSLISGYVKHGEPHRALLLYHEMKKDDSLKPSMYTYVALLKACANLKDSKRGCEIHSEITSKSLLETNVFIGSSLLHMYAQCGFLEKAQQVFDTLPIHNSFTWNALISGYAQCGEFEDIISYFDMMIQKGHKPDPITFLSILNSCSHAGLIEKGQTYYHVMAQVYGIIPNILHYACFIDVLGRAGQLDKVEAMILRIPFCPNTGLWLSMLGSCKKWCNADLGRYAFKHVVEIE